MGRSAAHNRQWSKIFFICLLAFFPVTFSRADTDDGTAKPLEVGSRLQPFLDADSIDVTSGVRLILHRPEKREVVFRFDAPWEGNESAYASLLRDGNEYRMYYRGGGESTREVTCLTTSTDGIHWHRPMLGQFEFDGSQQNNIVFTAQRKAYGESHNMTPFIDTNPACRPEERYKALALGHARGDDGDDHRALLAMASPDGIRWRRLSDKAVLTTGSFDSQNVGFWDPNIQAYACYLRIGRQGLRSIAVSHSSDFLHWSLPQALQFEPAQREHFYTNAIQLYPRQTSLYIGFPMRFVPERKTVGAERREIDGLSDAVMITSGDGVSFRRMFREAFIRPGPNPQNWGKAHANNTPVWGLLQLSPQEISVYWMENYADQAQVRRGVVRTDGFTSLNAGADGGEFVTRSLRFTGSQLVINYATSAVGSVRVEVQDNSGATIPGFGLRDCNEIYGDEIERTVSWNGGRSLREIEKQVVRLRFVMKDADLFSFRFAP